MSARIREATPADRDAWDAFLRARPEADVLQSWAWGTAGAAEPGERWWRVLAEGDEGRIRGVAQVLGRATSFRRTICYVPHGPVWEREAADSTALLAGLLEGVRESARRRRGIVVKLDPRAGETLEGGGAAAAENEGAAAQGGADALAALLREQGLRPARHDLQASTTRIVHLPVDPDAVTAGWTADGRAELRRATREGVVTRTWRGPDALALEAFHGLLAETSDRAGFRIRSRAFLGALGRALADGDGWSLALAEVDGRPIAGALAPRVGERAYYLYAASTRDPDMTRKRGAYAAMAALMADLSASGVRSLDLSGVHEPDDPSTDSAWEGFSLFKRRFGGTPLRHPGTFDLVVSAPWDVLREIRERARGRPA